MRIIIEMRQGSPQRQESTQNAQQAAFERYSFIIDVGSSWDRADLIRKRMREMSLREICQEAEVWQASGGNYLRALGLWGLAAGMWWGGGELVPRISALLLPKTPQMRV
jgi:hypothetical protein